MELREHNLFRQGKYRYECIPSYLISQAMRLGEERKARRDRTTRMVERAMVGGIVLTLTYLTWHMVLWVL